MDYHFDGADLKYIGGYDNYYYTDRRSQAATAIEGSPAGGAVLRAGGAALGAQITPCAVVPGCTGVNVRPRYPTYQENKHWSATS